MQNSTFPVAKAIQERRTIKQFKTDPIEEELLLELLNTASWAPNHGLREPWRFILFVGEGKQFLISKIAESARKPKDPVKLMQVPAYLAVIIKEDERQRQLEEDMLAAGTFVQNLQLAAWERGIGVKWLTDPYTFRPEFRTNIGLNSNEKLIGLLQIGYPDTIPEARPRTPIQDKLTVVRTL
ncbi:nitroreductase [Sporosarcina aquimarina]|uniref:nitroreductase family protein n=1 Tax=Sporosarcina aquimarina TaxID=114975 RepID=UPI00203B2DA7|nr:nitroreductase [Sporosarcina aquimarina]MCM3757370.1 nitroreductase [Sporosarcina aquimarina]